MTAAMPRRAHRQVGHADDEKRDDGVERHDVVPRGEPYTDGPIGYLVDEHPPSENLDRRLAPELAPPERPEPQESATEEDEGREEQPTPQ